MSVTDVFSKRLMELRESANMSQDELAEAAGISRGAISQYETGKRLPKIDVLERLSDALCASAQYLIGVTDNVKEEYSFTGMQLGLSDEAIEKWSNNEDATGLMDAIVCHEKFDVFMRAIFDYVTTPWPEVFGTDFQAFVITKHFIAILNDLREENTRKAYAMTGATGKSYTLLRDEIQRLRNIETEGRVRRIMNGEKMD